MVDLLHPSLHGKRDAFNFRIIDYPYLNCNMPSSSVYCIFISQLIRYAAPLIRSHDFPISLPDNRKKKRSGSGVRQKPLHPQPNKKRNVTTQKTPPKLRLHNDCGRLRTVSWVTIATQLVCLNRFSGFQPSH